MALFTWGDQFSVKIESIDKQHKKLIGLLNDAHEALIENRSKDTILEIFQGLIDYTKEHFIHEENLFREYGYPETELHKSQHEHLTKKVLDFKEKVDAGEDVDLLDVLAFLVDWLQDHILGSDMKYSDFLIGKGVK